MAGARHRRVPSASVIPPRSRPLNHVDEMFYELTCFGDEEVTFRARLATSSAICGLELPYALEPRWMTGACSIDPRYLVHVDPENTAELYTSWAPDVNVQSPDSSTPRDELPVVEVTGQYDHPAAQDCRAVVPSGTPSADLPIPIRSSSTAGDSL